LGGAAQQAALGLRPVQLDAASCLVQQVGEHRMEDRRGRPRRHQPQARRVDSDLPVLHGDGGAQVRRQCLS